MEREFDSFIILPALVESGMLLKIDWLWFLWFPVIGDGTSEQAWKVTKYN